MWLLVGGDSEVGVATWRHLRRAGRPAFATTRRPALASLDRPLLDLSSPLAGFEPPEGTRAACLLAAVARLAACQADPIGTAHVNVTGTLALAERLIARGIYVLFLSSDKVFAGDTANVPPEAEPCPVSEYGRQKARTEAALRQAITAGGRVAILRLSKVLSPDMALLRQWTEALAKGQPITAFSDMTMAPVPIDLVVAAISALLDDQATGIFQLTGPRDVSYAEVGRYLAARVGAGAGLVRAVSGSSAGLPAGSTPAHTTLDSSRLRDRYGIVVPEPWDAIESILSGEIGRGSKQAL